MCDFFEKFGHAIDIRDDKKGAWGRGGEIRGRQTSEVAGTRYIIRTMDERFNSVANCINNEFNWIPIL